MEVTIKGMLRYATAELAGSELRTLREVVLDLPAEGIEFSGTDLVFDLRYVGPSPQEAPLEGWSRLQAALQLAARFAVGGSLRWWIGGREFVAPAESDLPAFADHAPEVRRLLRWVVGEDFQGVEDARGQVTRPQLPALAEAYHELSHDLQRAALVLLVCDTLDSALLPVMRDALTLPEDPSEDVFAIARATALSHLEGDLQAHDWQDRPALNAAVRAYLERTSGGDG